ncbi:hypothetical protein RN04_12155 [Arthrobacter sp. W1]|nr:hypothetical protein RN04_12155 [Arthrobacter sp. W1]
MTVITQKAATMDSAQSAPTVRLAMREVRESAYRALMARGASNAEAQAAARQVLFAEVHFGTGLNALATWLQDGAWTPGALEYTRTETATGMSYAVAGTARCHALIHGVLLAEVAGAGTGNEVLCNAVDHECHLVDEALLNAALVTGRTVVHRSAGKANRTTYATPTGELGTGFSSADQDAPHTGPRGPHGSRFYTALTPPAGDFAVSTEAERTGHRVALAHSGIEVDASLWAHVRAVAAGYLVVDK